MAGEEAKAAKAEAKAAEARAKALRPFWKKKRFIIPVVLVVLGIGAAAGGGGGDDDGTVSSNDEQPSSAGESGGATTAPEPAEGDGGEPNPGALFPGRPDTQDEDQERNLGEPARLSGYTATVTAAGFQQELSTIETEGYIIIDVDITNRDDDAQPYNLFDWRLQTPGGAVEDPTFATVDGLLESGDLVGGGNVVGRVVFEVGEQAGDFFIVYKPDSFDAARGIWKVTVP